MDVNPPLACSTLADAARWLSETTGATWSERQVLSAALSYSLKATQKELSDAIAESRAAFAPEPVLWAALPADTRFHFRRWTVEAGTECCPTGWKLIPLRYENCLVLLENGSAVSLEFPRSCDPWRGADELCIDTQDTHQTVTPDMLRIYGRQLALLAAWVQAWELRGSEPEPPPQVITNGCDSWQARAVEIANRIALEWWKSGRQEITARGLAGKVTGELAKDPRNHGKRGPRSESNVRNLGLKGWKFIPQAPGLSAPNGPTVA